MATFIAKNFNPTADLVNPIGIQRKKAKAELEIDPITAEAKIIKCSL